MASTLDVPSAVYKTCVGGVHVELTRAGASVYVRSSTAEAAGFPRHVKAEVKLPTWDAPPVVAIALLVRLGGRPDLTFQHWINAGNPYGIRMLQQFSRAPHIPVFVVTDQIERSHRATNMLRTKAGYLVDELAPRIHAWSHEVFHETAARLDRLYPTAAHLWAECLRSERQGHARNACGTLAT